MSTLEDQELEDEILKDVQENDPQDHNLIQDERIARKKTKTGGNVSIETGMNEIKEIDESSESSSVQN